MTNSFRLCESFQELFLCNPGLKYLLYFELLRHIVSDHFDFTAQSGNILGSCVHEWVCAYILYISSFSIIIMISRIIMLYVCKHL